MFSSSLAYLSLKLRCELGVDMGSLLTVTLETATLAAAIAVAGTVLDKGPFGSGTFFDGAKYFSKAISISISLSLQLCVKCCVTKQTYHEIFLKFPMRARQLH